jgi:hypothetical protein
MSELYDTQERLDATIAALQSAEARALKAEAEVKEAYAAVRELTCKTLHFAARQFIRSGRRLLWWRARGQIQHRS